MEETLQNQSYTQIAEGTEVTADIISNKEIIISGKITGKTETTSNLTLLKTGLISGQLVAAKLDIAGKVKGEIRSYKKLVVRSSAHIEGDIFTSKILVEEGATINGNIRSGDNINIEKSTVPKPEMSSKQESKEEKPQPVENKSAPAPSRYVSNILISLQDREPNQDDISKLTKSCQNFMEALKYNLDTFDDPVLNPFFQKLIYVRKTTESDENIQSDFRRGKALLETAFMRKNGETNGNKLSNSAAEIVSSLKNLSDYVILLGKIMIVQYSEDSVQSLAVELVTNEMISALKQNERLTHQPKELYNQLTQ